MTIRCAHRGQNYGGKDTETMIERSGHFDGKCADGMLYRQNPTMNRIENHVA